jgi:hypothetical protein
LTRDANVSVRTRFERFPATLKGAFILRGENPDPHQVILRRAAIVALDGSGEHQVTVPDAILDIAPHRDVFVPFEVGVSELDPGWYRLAGELEVDGRPDRFEGDRRFVVPWPRATLRRGPIRVEQTAAVGDVKVRIAQLECGGDSMKLQLEVDPPTEVSISLSADGDAIPVLEVELDPQSGRGRVLAYPLLRTYPSLHVEIRGPARGETGVLDIPLP